MENQSLAENILELKKKYNRKTLKILKKDKLIKKALLFVTYSIGHGNYQYCIWKIRDWNFKFNQIFMLIKL